MLRAVIWKTNKNKQSGSSVHQLEFCSNLSALTLEPCFASMLASMGENMNAELLTMIVAVTIHI